MPAFVCRTCGVQHRSSPAPPAGCDICLDERQYVPPQGQRWTTVPELSQEGYRLEVRELEPGLTGVGAEPKVGIGQRALLVRTQDGNLLWDCFGFIDDRGIQEVRARGGLQGIAMSHPHFYGVCVERSQPFDHAPIFIPESDRRWGMRPASPASMAVGGTAWWNATVSKRSCVQRTATLPGSRDILSIRRRPPLGILPVGPLKPRQRLAIELLGRPQR